MSEETKKVRVLEGEVLESLPNTNFKVRTGEGDVVLCHVAGKLRRSFVRIMPGDRVRVEVSPHDIRLGRIVWRI